MKLKDKYLIAITIVVLILAGCVMHTLWERQLYERHIAELQGYIVRLEAKVIRVPTFSELQEKLNTKGYKLKVDGRLGPKTLTAWDEAICEQEAAKWDWMY